MKPMEAASPPRPDRVPHWLTLVGLLLIGVALWRQAQRLDTLEAVLRQQQASLAESGVVAAELADSVSRISSRPPLPETGPALPAGIMPLQVRVAALEQRLQGAQSGSWPLAGAPKVPEYDPDQPVPPEEPPEPEPEAWSAEQAIGPPDTPAAADARTAWASLEADGGAEWLQVRFVTAVEIAEVRVRESFNAGAIRRITALSGQEEVTLWEGVAAMSRGLRDFVVRPGPGVVSDTLTIHLETGEIAGWNEIDAVALVGRDGSRQWASSARASSSYASRGMVQLGGERLRNEF